MISTIDNDANVMSQLSAVPSSRRTRNRSISTRYWHKVGTNLRSHIYPNSFPKGRSWETNGRVHMISILPLTTYATSVTRLSEFL